VATLAAVITLGNCWSWLLRSCAQPPVIGEVLAGFLLGPSLRGALFPEYDHWLIPSAADDPGGWVPAAIQAVSQIGVILYMFVVGLELNSARLAGQAHAAVAVSHTSIVVPIVLGCLLAVAIYPRYSHRGVPFESFALFLGAAMAVTAFPVLARILTDGGLHQTELGSVALSCAAADDVSAWCLLALVMGVAQADLPSAVKTIVASVAFVALMLLIACPLAQRLIRRWDEGAAPLPSSVVAATFVAVLVSALATEAIGIHSLLGAFLLGAVIPHDSRVAIEFRGKLKETVTVLVLPAFFAYIGMRTQITLLDSTSDWFWCGVIVLTATAGKFGGTLCSTRRTGMSWRYAAALGVLMNARGLMELIVRNIGQDLGIISPALFAMLVVMALATTAMTAPLLDRLQPAANPSHP
jgi:Kef-type K+ transport system membrane component KefB